jgi:hypothetical protein
MFEAEIVALRKLSQVSEYFYVVAIRYRAYNKKNHKLCYLRSLIDAELTVNYTNIIDYLIWNLTKKYLNHL